MTHAHHEAYEHDHSPANLNRLAASATRLDTPLLFPAPKGGYIGLDAWRTREWYPALEGAGIEKRDAGGRELRCFFRPHGVSRVTPYLSTHHPAERE